MWVVFNTIHGMAFLYENSAWKEALLVAVLVVFVCVGITAVVNPDSFIRRSGLPRGGEMLTEWNRFGCRLSGAAFAGAAMYMLYAFLRDVLAK